MPAMRRTSSGPLGGKALAASSSSASGGMLPPSASGASGAIESLTPSAVPFAAPPDGLLASGARATSAGFGMEIAGLLGVTARTDADTAGAATAGLVTIDFDVAGPM